MKFSFTLILALAAGMSGCQSPSQYVWPRITGRVVDEQTHQPLRGVRVSRASDARPAGETAQGGAKAEHKASVRTGADGCFVLQSERYLAFLQELQWYSVQLSFAYPGYETLTRKYTLADSTNTLAGEPLVETGDVRLRPVPRQ
jgi:hypothetical protein